MRAEVRDALSTGNLLNKLRPRSFARPLRHEHMAGEWLDSLQSGTQFGAAGPRRSGRGFLLGARRAVCPRQFNLISSRAASLSPAARLLNSLKPLARRRCGWRANSNDQAAGRHSNGKGARRKGNERARQTRWKMEIDTRVWRAQNAIIYSISSGQLFVRSFRGADLGAASLLASNRKLVRSRAQPRERLPSPTPLCSGTLELIDQQVSLSACAAQIGLGAGRILCVCAFVCTFVCARARQPSGSRKLGHVNK